MMSIYATGRNSEDALDFLTQRQQSLPVPEPLKALFDKAVQICGLSNMDIGLIMDPAMPPDDAAGGIDVDRTHYAVFLNPVVLEVCSKQSLLSTIMHELGHIAHDDSAERHKFLESLGLPAEEIEKQEGNCHFWSQFPGAQEMLWRQEYAADAFVKAHGYGARLANSLEEERERSPDSHDGCTTHPPMAERLRRLLD